MMKSENAENSRRHFLQDGALAMTAGFLAAGAAQQARGTDKPNLVSADDLSTDVLSV